MADIFQTFSNTFLELIFIPWDLINSIPVLVQIMAWRRLGDKPLSEPMFPNLNLAHRGFNFFSSADA